MDSRHDKRRMNAECDRLSNLPDDIIHKIFSFLEITQAIEMIALSSRWRYLWTSLPSLNFSSVGFQTLSEFSKFITHVLSRRNDQIEVCSVKLTFRGNFSQPIVEQILNYAFSHNVQQLNITCLLRTMEFPLSLLSSQSLKHLTLDWYANQHLDWYGNQHSKVTPSTWELPALTTLNLYHVTLYDDGTNNCANLFSNCTNLKNLTFKNCTLTGLNGFNIRHPGLSSLTLDNGCVGVNVITPQLKNLTIKYWRGVNLVSAPNLSSLCYKDYGYGYYDEDDYNGDSGCDYNYYDYDDDHHDDDNNDDDHDHDHDDGVDDDDDGGPDHHDDRNIIDPLQIFTQLSHLEKAHICIERPFEDKAYIHKLLNLLQQLHSVKFLTLNSELVELLCSSLELISHQPSPFSNLRSLKFYPADVTLKEQLQPEVTIVLSPEVKKYLIDSSPGATLTVVSREEIRAMMYVASARKVLGELKVLLEEWKENSETNTAHLRQENAPMYSRHMVTVHEQVEDAKTKWHSGKRVTDIKSYWADPKRQMEKGIIFTNRTISMLQKIETALTRMPTSYRAKLKAEFSSLSAEAKTMIRSQTVVQTSTVMNLQPHPQTRLPD